MFKKYQILFIRDEKQNSLILETLKKSLYIVVHKQPEKKIMKKSVLQ
jgi:hypothetical protein